MDKKKIEELMQKRSPIARETVKPVDFFDLQPVNQEEGKTVKQQNGKPDQFAMKEENSSVKEDRIKETPLIKYTTYLPEELITKIKIQAALQRKKGCQIIQEALEKFFEKG